MVVTNGEHSRFAGGNVGRTSGERSDIMSEEIIDEGNTSVESWVRRFRENIDRQYVSNSQVDRGATLLETVARMAIERRYTIAEPSTALYDEAKRSKWPWPHLIVRGVDGFMSSFHLSELSKPGTAPKPRTLAGVPKSDDPQWIEERSREFEPTGMLSLRVNGDRPFARQRSLRDTVNSRIDERLDTLFDGLHDEIAVSHERAEADRRREVTIGQAQRECRGERLYTALCEEVQLHGMLESQRSYLDLVEQRLRRIDPDRLMDASDDIEMMRRRIDARDPLTTGGVDWLDQPEPTDLDIYEYMHRNQFGTTFDRDGSYRDRTRRPPRRTMPSIGNGRFFD